MKEDRTQTSPKARVTISIDPELLEEIDKEVKLSHINRSAWIIQSLLEKLDKRIGKKRSEWINE